MTVDSSPLETQAETPVPTVDRPADWPPEVRIRPHPSVAGSLEVVNVESGQTFRWRPPALAKLILSGTPGRALSNGADRRSGAAAWHRFMIGSDRAPGLVPGLKHWHKRGWFPSDQFYLASRRWNYVDEFDHSGHIREQVLRRFLNDEGPPPDPARLDGPQIEFEETEPPGPAGVVSLLKQRVTARSFLPEPIAKPVLAGILHYGFAELRTRLGAVGADSPLSYLDSYGSAWDPYLAIFSVDDVEPGIYRYDITDHALTQVRSGDHRDELVSCLQGMNAPRLASFVLILVADFPRFQWRYRHEHALRRLYIETGIMAQELIVIAMSHGLGTLVTPAQRDSETLTLLDLPADRYCPVYTLTCGPTRHDREAGEVST